MQSPISRLVRFVIKLVLAAFGLVFAASLVLAALVVIVLSLLKSLFTWKKPAPFVFYSQFKQLRRGARGRWPFTSQPASQSDVVDVEAHEVKQAGDDKRLP